MKNTSYDNQTALRTCTPEYDKQTSRDQKVDTLLRNHIEVSLFLGGSIELGAAENWQERVINLLSANINNFYTPVTIYNPRNDNWDSTIDPADPSQKFLFDQITWELEKQQLADINIYYFAADTMSPITLLELGAHKDDNTIIYIDDNFQRKANVQLFCDYYDLQWYDDYNQFANKVVSETQKLSVQKL